MKDKELSPSKESGDGDSDDEKSQASSQDQEERETPLKRKTRSSRSASRKAMAKLKEALTDDEEDEDEEEDDVDDDEEEDGDDSDNADADETEDDEAQKQDNGGGKKKHDEGDLARPKKKRKKGKGKEKGTHKCPHCEKELGSLGGLKYHVAKFVCRMDQCTDPEILAKANKKKRTRGKTKVRATDTPKGSKRFRGKLEDRVCPNCKRVFTSTLGLNYHLSRKVCAQKKSNEKKMILHNLEAGERFMTPYGVVEVIADDRGESVAPLKRVPPLELRAFNTSKNKVEKTRHKILVSKYTRLRARKRQINQLLEEGTSVNKASVFSAYHGGNPTELNQNKKLTPMPQMPDDVHIPPESCPDRIVECAWVQPDAADSENPTSSQRLFLQRRVLTEPFVGVGNINACEDCGRRFTSTPGYSYHVRHRVCISRRAKLKAARKETQHAVEAGATRILAKDYVPPEFEPGEPKPTNVPRKKKKKGKRKKVLGLYPEVLISLGYKVIKEDIKITDDMLFGSNEPQPVDTNETRAAPPTTLSLTTDAPEIILDDLKKKLEERQRVADDQKYGSMYKEVYKALRYKRPKKQKDVVSSIRARKRAKVVKPPPPIIDISALADEIDSGRYPSKKRYKGDDHADYCTICKEGGKLLCCDFCRNAVHMHCMADKFTIKAPEPDEDFMCHKCIQTIMARRKRAEGRRLKKQEKDEADQIKIQRQNPDIKAGMEYEQLESTGQEYSELIELLQDARQRLRQSLATSKMNDIRRKLVQFD